MSKTCRKKGFGSNSAKNVYSDTKERLKKVPRNLKVCYPELFNLVLCYVGVTMIMVLYGI